MVQISRILAPILAYMAVGCAPIGHPDPRPIRSIGDDFKPYVADFEASYDWVVTTPIGFVDQLPDNKIGTCHTKTIKSGFPTTTYVYKWISIRRSYWDKATDISRLGLIYHELIHCEFEIHVHYNTLYSDYCPTSIMNNYLPSVYCLNKYWNSYVNEWQ